jgi:hypothetical protein
LVIDMKKWERFIVYPLIAIAILHGARTRFQPTAGQTEPRGSFIPDAVTLATLELGQALEFKTGTIGQQQFWAKEILKLQMAGALASPDIAQQVLLAIDRALAEQGGIKSPAVRELAAQLAPFVGAAGLNAREIGSLFDFATTAGVASTQPAYEKFFAQLLAVFRTSKSPDFGSFVVGAHREVSSYMASGGTLEDGLVMYVMSLEPSLSTEPEKK